MYGKLDRLADGSGAWKEMVDDLEEELSMLLYFLYHGYSHWVIQMFRGALDAVQYVFLVGILSIGSICTFEVPLYGISG